MQLEPYLSFNGDCEDALAFYCGVFGGEVTALNRFAGSPMEANLPPDYSQKIMHANFKSPTLAFMASDAVPSGGQPPGNRVSLSLATSDVAEAERVFAMLAQDGKISMPLQDTFWGAKFGMLTDKYGIDWLVNCARA